MLRDKRPNDEHQPHHRNQPVPGLVSDSSFNFHNDNDGGPLTKAANY